MEPGGFAALISKVLHNRVDWSLHLNGNVDANLYDDTLTSRGFHWTQFRNATTGALVAR